MTGNELREAIFNMRTSRPGKAGELLIKRLYSLGKAKNIFHDLYDDISKNRYEVKFSYVRKNTLAPSTKIPSSTTSARS